MDKNEQLNIPKKKLGGPGGSGWGGQGGCERRIGIFCENSKKKFLAGGGRFGGGGGSNLGGSGWM